MSGHMPLRFTDLHCVIGTHLKPCSIGEQQATVAAVECALMALNTREGYRAALAMDDPDKIRRVLMANASIEIGEKYGRVHTHFNLYITHTGKFLLSKANEQLATWFDAQFPWQRRCFAAADLLGTSAVKNYNAKGDRVIDSVDLRRRDTSEPQ